MTIQQFKTFAIKELSSSGLQEASAPSEVPLSSSENTFPDKNAFQSSPTPALDVSVIMEHFLKMTKTSLLLNATRELSAEEENVLRAALEKRKTGLPVAYITGHKEFYGYDFFVTPDVLIPKPDTEILVEKALDVIIEKMDARPEIVLSICDMCTGSGCIGISVLKQLLEEYKISSGSLPKLTMCDISGAALEIAQKNARTLLPPEEFEAIRFIQTNLFSEVDYTFDLILTNPPYVPAKMTDELLKDGRNEPRLALDGDVGIFGEPADSDDGLELIRRLIPESYNHLAGNGVILMETGEYNAEKASDLAKEAGFRNVKIHRDLEGQLRVTEGIR